MSQTVVNRMAVAAAVCVASCALARPDRESVSYANVASDGPLNSVVNSVRNPVFVGGYAVGLVRFSGTLTSVHPLTWRTDSRVMVTAPGGSSAFFQPFLTGSTFSSLGFSGTMVLAPGTDPTGVWTLRFFEALDDGGPGQVDARWDVTMTLTDDPPPPPAATNLGTLLAPGTSALNVPISEGQIRWFKFTVPFAASSALHTYVDVDTVGSVLAAQPGTGTYQDDTVVGLFDAAGGFVASDDDSGPGYTSQLSFGWGIRPAVGNGQPYNGRHGPLPAGVYYLALGTYPVAFGSSYWSAIASGTQSGTVTLNLRTNLAVTQPVCYANCDGSTIAPILNVNDFVCFQTRFAVGDSSANCDGSTLAPVLNVNDFVCFLTAYGAGCP